MMATFKYPWTRAGSLALLGLLGGSAMAATTTNLMYKPAALTAGGLSPCPYILSVTNTGDGALGMQWQGFIGPFQVQESPTVAPAAWQDVGAVTNAHSATVPLSGNVGILRVEGGTPYYLGDRVCGACHGSIHQSWSGTEHASAFSILVNAGQATNSSCIACHTVGYGLPTGFQSAATTPDKENVQCENCHGPGGYHVANILDPSLRPQVTLAAEVCGGCHSGSHHPTYSEWESSPHATVVPHVASGFLSSGESEMRSCGACHSGAVRMAMLQNWQLRQTQPTAQMVYPAPEDAAYFGVTCVVCHDPHDASLPHQLRNPLYSTNFFSYSTASTTSFAAQYDPNIQLCAQCHNMRGATWEDTSRPPHHSPQYNMLIGLGGYDPNNSQIIAPHGQDLPEQCASCHVVAGASPTNPNSTGHTFKVAYSACAECHFSANIGELLVEGTQQATKAMITNVVDLLNDWATNKAPADLQSKYGTLSWEYTHPGELSTPADGSSVQGPSTAEQAEIPDAIKQARMNLYFVDHDGSFGVHNAFYTKYLLNVAITNIQEELAKP